MGRFLQAETQLSLRPNCNKYFKIDGYEFNLLTLKPIYAVQKYNNVILCCLDFVRPQQLVTYVLSQITSNRKFEKLTEW